MSQKTEATRLDPLTSLRFVTAVMIVTVHAYGHFSILDTIPEPKVLHQSLTFFFCLSGFILAYTYPPFASGRKVFDYLVKRFARLWPLHISVFLLRFLMFPKVLLTFPGAAPSFLVFLANVCMVHSWIPFFQFYFSYNAPSWSISTELFFYLCMPVLLTLMARSLWLPIGISFGITCGCIIICNMLGLDEMSQNGLSLRGLLYINPVPRLFEFVIGMVGANLFRRHFEHAQMSKFAKTVLELVVVVACSTLIWNAKLISEPLLPFIGPAGVYWLENSGIALFAFTTLIFTMARGGGLVSWILSAPPLVLLGEVSYAIYLCHHPLLVYHGLYLSQYRSNWALLFYCAILFLVSHLLYTLVERPFRSMIVKQTRSLVDTGFKASLKERKVALENGLKKLFAQPRRPLFITAEISLLVGLLVFSNAAPEKITVEKAENLIAGANLLPNEVKIGDSFSCLGVVADRNKDSKLEFVFKATKPETLNQYLAVQTLDSYGNAIYEQITTMAPRKAVATTGDIWVETIELPRHQLDRAAKVGLVLSRIDLQQMPFSGSQTDTDGKRLLIDLAPQVSDRKSDTSL